MLYCYGSSISVHLHIMIEIIKNLLIITYSWKEASVGIFK